MVTAIIRTIGFVHDPNQVNLFYFVNNFVCILILTFIAWLNNSHRIKLAAACYTILSIYLCFSAYPLQNPDQVLLYLAIPAAISSFISDEKNSLRLASMDILLFTIAYFQLFPGYPYPVYSVVCLILIATITWWVSTIIEQMIGQLVNAYDTTIEGWSQALEMRNQETEGHSHRVVNLTLQLVNKMRGDETRLVHIKRGALLHDIGKMGVPDSILCKSGPLTEAEHKIMRNHPIFANELLSKIPYLAPALEIPYCHHEKWDGTGYPRGLQGDEIPLEARIFSVVDVWDAMRSKRSYRDEIPELQVVEYLRSETGRSFDPVVINAFFELMGFKIETVPDPGRLMLSQNPQKLNH
jgi:HD-GYP domain-containing protein (c-di-GMP phosphodiesterase class II)